MMDLPFSTEEFLAVFKKYNTAVWPLQFILILLALAATFLIFKKKPTGDGIIIFILALLWLWMGIIYHLIYFTEINKAAYLFAGVFIFQAALFLYSGVLRNKISFRLRLDFYGTIAVFFIFYAISVYPLISFLSGHVYPATPTFGLPCPTTIFTLGILLWANKKTPLYIFIIPLLWSIVGFFAAIRLGMFENIFLFIAGLIVLTRITGNVVHKKKKSVTIKFYEKS